MRTRNSMKAQSRWLAPTAVLAVAGSLMGCPSQELAPLTPCTVSGVSLEVPQSGVDKVDLLFMIDNSQSMAEEQKKLADVLPKLVQTLTTGQLNPAMPKEKPDFPPVKSLNIGVISSDMGVGTFRPGPPSCGTLSFNPTAPNPNSQANPPNPASNAQRIERLFGDDGIMNVSTAVAVAGITLPGDNTPVVVPPDPSCQALALQGRRFINFEAGMSNADMVAKQFGCIAKLGRNGCGLEQQLESTLKAVTPNTSAITFSRNTKGKGNMENNGFLREDAILAVVLVTDEEDCSVPDQFSEMFNPTSTVFPENINVRCSDPKYVGNLYPTARYIEGIQALKPEAYRDRLIFAGIVGVPLTQKGATFSGEGALNGVLMSPGMQFGVTLNAQMQPTQNQACNSPTGAGSATPARRMVEVAKGFGDNGVITSICEDEYGSALDVIIRKIADQLTGACLPRKLSPDANGKVECDVIEILPNNTMPCDTSKGRDAMALPARNINGTLRTVCRINQVPVMNKTLGAGTGWYYDDFSPNVIEECQTDPQRIAFTPGAEPTPGSQTRFECFQPVSSADQNSVGVDAVNLPCDAAAGDGLCQSKDPGLVCIQAGTCQFACTNASQCPDSWLCAGESGRADGVKFCVNPTCPQSTAAQQ